MLIALTRQEVEESILIPLEVVVLLPRFITLKFSDYGLIASITTTFQKSVIH